MPHFRTIASVVAFSLLVASLAVTISSVYSAGVLSEKLTCPSCRQPCDNKTCRSEPTTIKEKKHCWEVGWKDICIPHVRFPWTPCDSPPKCGLVRSVRVLKKVEYECEKCGYKWDVKCVQCCNE